MRFILLCFVWFPMLLQAQMQGHVVDAESNEDISNALLVEDSTTIAITDKHGYFRLDTIHRTVKLSVRSLGYEDGMIEISPVTRNIVIKLTPNVHQLAEVLVSNQLSVQKLRSIAGNYSMITHNDLLRGNSITVADYFNQIPGVFMQQGALNTNRLTIRGVGSRTPYITNRIKAYFDEIPLTTGDGATTLEDIDMVGISRIEILKGPSSALYGAGLGGVVRYYPASRSADHSLVRYQSQAGSFGTFKNTVSSSVNLNNYDLTAVLSRVYSDGYRQNSQYARNSMFVFGTHYWGKSNLKATLNVIGVNAHIPSSINQQTFDENPQAAAANWLAIKGYEDYTKALGGLTWSNMVSPSLLSQTTVFMGSLDHYQSRPFNILWENSLDEGLRQKFTYTRQNETFVTGFEWFNEDYTWKIYNTNMGAKGALTSKNKENRNYWNLFLLWNLVLQEKLVLETGVNINTLAYRITDEFADAFDNSGHYRYTPVVSPKLGLNYKLSSAVNLYSSIGHGFSAPSLQETLLPEGQPNVNIKPEEGYNLDVGARFNLWNDRLYIEVTQYWMYLQNLLVTKRLTEDIFTGANAGKTNHRGLEVTAKFSVLPHNDGKSALELSFTYTNSENRFRSFADTAGDYSGKELPGIPFSSLNLNATMTINRIFHLYLNFQRIGKQYITDDNTKSYRAYQLIGLKAAYELTAFRKCQFNLYAGIQNLFNQRYASMILVNAPKLGAASPRYYYPGNPRSFYAGISMTFGK